MGDGSVARMFLFAAPAFLLSLILVGVATSVARRAGIYALPGARQLHTVVTPTGGGFGMVLALCLASWAAAFWIPLVWPWSAYVAPVLLLLAAVGWIDDRRTVLPLLRFFIQLTVSFGLLILLRPSVPWLEWPVVGLGGIVLTWVMNMYNFMDGSNGMAGAQGLFAAAVVTVLSLAAGHAGLAMIALLTAACCAGFLPWNFPRPRVFMGDAGSVPLGFALGALLLLGVVEGVISVPVAALILLVFLIDSGWTLLTRMVKGERWYTPHKQHVYQRLIAHGWPHARVMLVYQAVNIMVVVPAIVLIHNYPDLAWPVGAAVALLLSAGWYAARSRLAAQT
jgi:UDP-N-acetylmuramyl pentapeptide phosphotransferase/UDP-N-acetylglucosamine-1-phosphate transferase